MFGLSFWEIAIILAIALILLGPKKLPELARSLGKGLREFRRATEDFRSTVDEEMRVADPARPVPPPAPAKALPEGQGPEATSEEAAREPVAKDPDVNAAREG